VEILGTPVAKAYKVEDGSIRSEIRLTVIKTNILRTVTREEFSDSDNNSLEDVFSDDL
jgi:hypothetical protein